LIKIKNQKRISYTAYPFCFLMGLDPGHSDMTKKSIDYASGAKAIARPANSAVI
jgi:hypothetical protein